MLAETFKAVPYFCGKCDRLPVLLTTTAIYFAFLQGGVAYVQSSSEVLVADSTFADNDKVRKDIAMFHVIRQSCFDRTTTA